MGPMQDILGMIPGIGNKMKDVQVDDRALARTEAIILSMTPSERNKPGLIDGSRRKRISKGSGTSLNEVNKVLKQFNQMQKMMKMVGSGKMPRGMGIPGQAMYSR